MSQNDLTPKEIKELATFFQQFFDYMEKHPDMRTLWKADPFLAVESYKRLIAIKHKEQAENE